MSAHQYIQEEVFEVDVGGPRPTLQALSPVMFMFELAQVEARFGGQSFVILGNHQMGMKVGCSH
jgi:hypothetical protein